MIGHDLLSSELSVIFYGGLHAVRNLENGHAATSNACQCQRHCRHFQSRRTLKRPNCCDLWDRYLFLVWSWASQFFRKNCFLAPFMILAILANLTFPHNAEEICAQAAKKLLPCFGEHTEGPISGKGVLHVDSTPRKPWFANYTDQSCLLTFMPNTCCTWLAVITNYNPHTHINLHSFFPLIMCSWLQTD